MEEGTIEDYGSICRVKKRAWSMHVIVSKLTLVRFQSILIEKCSFSSFATI